MLPTSNGFAHRVWEFAHDSDEGIWHRSRIRRHWAFGSNVLHSLYGVGTDITVTESPKAGSGLPSHRSRISIQGGLGQKSTVCSMAAFTSGLS